eukprot:gnl/TRDRNA2_/TRDRNA2_87571_c0_seq1.p1 gnl/TRDRNA2_/TRDRNA2_87571_c0~~gnl/TRDRNA2_/TRDRNA2_87571_c0_seq1.p1  ORF type:complete len:370 (+),score=124.48 gnl/TRDRNA2_/TRDRNA2_87571_c0_seq1:78-1187(+)
MSSIALIVLPAFVIGAYAHVWAEPGMAHPYYSPQAPPALRAPMMYESRPFYRAPTPEFLRGPLPDAPSIQVAPRQPYSGSMMNTPFMVKEAGPIIVNEGFDSMAAGPNAPGIQYVAVKDEKAAKPAAAKPAAKTPAKSAAKAPVKTAAQKAEEAKKEKEAKAKAAAKAKADKEKAAAAKKAADAKAKADKEAKIKAEKAAKEAKIKADKAAKEAAAKAAAKAKAEADKKAAKEAKLKKEQQAKINEQLAAVKAGEGKAQLKILAKQEAEAKKAAKAGASKTQQKPDAKKKDDKGPKDKIVDDEFRKEKPTKKIGFVEIYRDALVQVAAGAGNATGAGLMGFVVGAVATFAVFVSSRRKAVASEVPLLDA